MTPHELTIALIRLAKAQTAYDKKQDDAGDDWFKIFVSEGFRPEPSRKLKKFAKEAGIDLTVSEEGDESGKWVRIKAKLSTMTLPKGV